MNLQTVVLVRNYKLADLKRKSKPKFKTDQNIISVIQIGAFETKANRNSDGSRTSECSKKDKKIIQTMLK